MKSSGLRRTSSEKSADKKLKVVDQDQKQLDGQTGHLCLTEVRILENESGGEQKASPYRTFGLFGDPNVRPGIAGTAYDTAWLAGVPGNVERRSSRFPTSLQWLVENQLADGSWGSTVRYEHDRILCTLAAIVPLATFGRRASDRASVEAATRYLWQHCHLLPTEPMELVGFELLLPTLIRRAQRAGINVPPNLDIYGAERAEKLRLIPPSFLYSSKATVVHSLEFLDDEADLAGLRSAQGENGAIGNSPAATAFFLTQGDDDKAVAYLESCLSRGGGAVAPVLYPCETFELLWAAYHLYLAGVPAALLLNGDERALLRGALRDGGVSLSPTFPIADADDTAVSLILLHELGDQVNAGVLSSFALPNGYFASFPHERHSSVGVNLHVLHALLRVPGYPDSAHTIEQIVEYLADQQVGGLYWIDKWHISPYYATAHALCILDGLPPHLSSGAQPLTERSKEWVRQTQNSDGSWGFYGQPTAEETAYAVLGLASGGPAGIQPRDLQQCAEAISYLRRAVDTGRLNDDGVFPALWIDKCLYTPTLVVSAAIEAAFTAYARLRRAIGVRRGRTYGKELIGLALDGLSQLDVPAGKEKQVD